MAFYALQRRIGRNSAFENYTDNLSISPPKLLLEQIRVRLILTSLQSHLSLGSHVTGKSASYFLRRKYGSTVATSKLRTCAWKIRFHRLRRARCRQC
jgi:hypothetical protein